MKRIFLVEMVPGMDAECAGDDELGIELGSRVVVQFEKHQDCGLVTRIREPGSARSADDARTRGERLSGERSSAPAKGAPPLEEPEVVRLMTESDCHKAEENEARAASMFKTAQRKVREHHLTMKLINCHYSLDKSIAFFQFSAEGRVDFRSLVRDLSGALHTRIELRQIGVRDEAGIIGGIGVCGRPFCCAQFLERFHSVNVKMAKIQRLSLNPASVSGGCGRLKCCLRYEVDGYKEMCRHLPRTGSLCETPDGCGRVVDCNALTQKVRVRLDDGGAQYKDFDVTDIAPATGGSGGKRGHAPNPKSGEKQAGEPEQGDGKNKRQDEKTPPAAPDGKPDGARKKSRRRKSGGPRNGKAS